MAVYGLPADYWQTYRARLEAVQPDDVRAAALDLIHPDQLLILATGDAARIRADVEAAVGPAEVVSPD